MAEKARLRKFDREQRAAAMHHVMELAHKHHITVRTAKRWDLAEAHVKTRQVWIARTLLDDVLYLSALHELGHIASPDAHRLTARSDFTGGLMCEAAAWAWAFEHADPRFTGRRPGPDFWQIIGGFFGTHLWHGYRARLREEPA